MSVIKKIFKFPFIKLAIVYFCIVGVLYSIQDSLLFPIPNTSVETLPDYAKFVEMKTSDGETLTHIHLAGDEGAPKLIFFHGNGTLAGHEIQRGRVLQENGFDVLLAEYRGYGKSSGKPSAELLLRDSLEIYDWYKSDESDWVFLYGFSLGTGVASYLSSKRPVQSMVLEAPYSSLADVAASKYFLFPARMLIKHEINPAKYLQDTKLPILIIHGTDDVVIPVEFGQALYKTLNPDNAKIEIIDDADHTNLMLNGSVGMALGHFSRSF